MLHSLDSQLSLYFNILPSYSRTHTCKYCNQNSTSSSTRSYCIIKGLLETSGTGARVLVAIIISESYMYKDFEYMKTIYAMSKIRKYVYFLSVEATNQTENQLPKECSTMMTSLPVGSEYIKVVEFPQVSFSQLRLFNVHKKFFIKFSQLISYLLNY